MNRGRITQIGDTLVSCRRDTRGAFVSVAGVRSKPLLRATRASQRQCAVWYLRGDPKSSSPQKASYQHQAVL